MHPKPTRAPRGQARRIKRKRPMGWRRREAKAAGDLTPEQMTVICDAFRSLCAYCRTAVGTQGDHFVPIAKGGLHTASNWFPACETCNMRKSTSRKWAVPSGHPFYPYRKDTP